MAKRNSGTATATAPARKQSSGSAKSASTKTKASSKAKTSTRKTAAKQKKSKTIAASHDQVAQRAYGIWESKGRPYGLDQEIWLEAEQQLGVAGAS